MPDINKPLNISIKGGMQTGLIFGDLHIPFEDKAAVRLLLRFIEKNPVNFIVINGDLCDFYLLSSFAKDPGRKDKMQDDIIAVRAFLNRLTKAAPNSNIIFLEGNHENRLQRYLWTKAEELSSLSELSIKHLYSLDDFRIKHIPYEAGLLINGAFLILHGDIVSKHSGYTAKLMFEKHGGCGICGHTHRGGSYYKRDRFGTWGWWEGFCLCSLNPDWVKNPNWQQGFSLIHFTDTKRFWIEQVPIIGHELLYGNEIYR